MSALIPPIESYNEGQSPVYANSLLAALNSRGSIRTTLIESNSNEMSTNFIAIAGDTENTDIHVQDRDSTEEYHVQDVSLETMEEERQPGVSVYSLVLFCKLRLKGLCFR